MLCGQRSVMICVRSLKASVLRAILNQLSVVLLVVTSFIFVAKGYCAVSRHLTKTWIFFLLEHPMYCKHGGNGRMFSSKVFHFLFFYTKSLRSTSFIYKLEAIK